MNANRKEGFARFREALGVQLALSGAEGLRVTLDRSNALPKKRCEDAPHSQSTACETPPRPASISVIRGKKKSSQAATILAHSSADKTD
jgi:hypothetical protein